MTTQSNPSGIGFSSALGILFIALKLTGTITWSWGWVLAPIWIPFCLGFLVICVFAILGAFADTWRE